MTLATAVRADTGRPLGWPALFLRGTDAALTRVPKASGRIMGVERRGRQHSFANPDLDSGPYAVAFEQRAVRTAEDTRRRHE